MKGFTWSPRWIDPSHRILPGDHWCVRDDFCALLDWDPGSEEWDIFIEAPSPDDMDPLIEHLGLVARDAAPTAAATLPRSFSPIHQPLPFLRLPTILRQRPPSRFQLRRGGGDSDTVGFLPL
jgi:hypothetical protein